MPENTGELNDFVSFPHTPHIAWLSEQALREDKLLDEQELHQLLNGEVVIEEKIDGANLGVSFSGDGELLIQHRGGYLSPPWEGEYHGLDQWITSRQENLFDELEARFILFGEWCRSRHSIPYDRLPDYLIGFDVFDRRRGYFLDNRQRNSVLKRLEIPMPCLVGRGVFSITDVIAILQNSESCYRSHGEAEGLYLRRCENGRVVARGKLVNSGFVQSIDTHWRDKVLPRNTTVFEHRI
jgi:hypothetical protein